MEKAINGIDDLLGIDNTYELPEQKSIIGINTGHYENVYDQLLISKH